MQKEKTGLRTSIDELSINKRPVKKKLQQSENEEHLQSKIIKISMEKQEVAKEPQKIQSIDGKLHSNIDYSATVKDGRCIKCNKEYSGRIKTFYIKRHYETCQEVFYTLKKEIFKVNQIESSSKKTHIICPYCEEEILRGSFFSHCKEKNNKRQGHFVCKFKKCKNVFETKEDFNIHNTQKKHWECFKCQKTFNGRVGLFIHKEKYHSVHVNKKSKLKCDFGCTGTLKNLQGKRHHHKSIHGGEKKKEKKCKK